MEQSTTLQSFLAVGNVDEARRQKIQRLVAFLLGVVRDEDYATGRGIGRALASGARRGVLFGRNEGGGQRFHRWVEALTNTEDADLPGLFSTGPPARVAEGSAAAPRASLEGRS